MATFRLIQEPDITLAYIAIKVPYKPGDETNHYKKLLLLNKVKAHIEKEIKITNDAIEQEQMQQLKQITIEQVIHEEENKVHNAILPKKKSSKTKSL